MWPNLEEIGWPWLSSLVSFSFSFFFFLFFFFEADSTGCCRQHRLLTSRHKEQAAKVLIEPTTSSVTKHAAAKGRLYGKDY